jgi:glycosyltransferase involved in cell wall biosynthesis
MPKLALVLNEPPPYRIPILNRVAATPDVKLKVIFCCRREPNRFWDLPPMQFDASYLRERITTVNGRYIHNNPEVYLALGRFSPDVVIGNGFNPTHLYAMSWCALFRRVYVPMTDGTLQSERALSRVHTSLRRIVYRRARSVIAASNGGFALYQQYGVPRGACYRSCLCIDNDSFRIAEDKAQEKAFDFIFCGRLEPGKQPAFAIEVAARCASLLMRKTRLLIVGSGSLEKSLRLRAQAHAANVEVVFNGFAKQAELPTLYHAAKVFLFPTEADVWGVVANEACAAGLPVIISPHAGAADELVVDRQNGFVRKLDLEQWADCAASLLSNDGLRQTYGQRSRMMVEPYNFDQSASGIIEAVKAAVGPFGSRTQAVRRPV